MVPLLTFSLLLLSVRWPYMTSGQTPVPPSITAEISPTNSTVQREGDTVSFLCRVDNFDVIKYRLTWYNGRAPAYSSEHALVNQGRYSTVFERNDADSFSYIFNLTVDAVMESDSGMFTCNLLEKTGFESTVGTMKIDLFLSVYPVEAFPICSPNDQSSVAVGNLILCETNGAATPVIAERNDEWVYFMTQETQASLLVKNVTSSDDGKTFVCMAEIYAAQMNLSCNIGPLTVTPSNLSTVQQETSSQTLTTIRPSVTDTGISVAAIFGIVIGAIILIIFIVIHTLCCHCDPRKWMDAKSRLLNLRSSTGTANQGTDSAIRQPRLETTERHDLPPSSSSVLDDAAGASKPENVYAEPEVASGKPNLDIDARLNINIAFAVNNTENGQDELHPSHKVSRVETGSRTLSGTVSSNDEDDNGEIEAVQADTAGKATLSQQIYTKVSKPIRNKTENDENTSFAASGNDGKPKTKMKPNIKKYGIDNDQKFKSDDPSHGPIVYADLNLDGAEDGGIKLAEDPRAVYAQIKH